jgi:hypothetical protein
MTLDIHAPMQDADHYDCFGSYSVKQHVRAYRIPPIAGSHVIALRPNLRIGRHCLDSGLDESKVDFSLSFTPILNRVIPNVVNVPSRTRRDDEIPGHLPLTPMFALPCNEGLEIEGRGGTAGFALV